METDALPGNFGAELPVRSISAQLSTSRYLQFRFRVLTASMPEQASLHICAAELCRRTRGRLDNDRHGRSSRGATDLVVLCREAVSPPARRQLLRLIQSTMVVLTRVGSSYVGRWPTSGSTRTVTLGISSANR